MFPPSGRAGKSLADGVMVVSGVFIFVWLDLAYSIFLSDSGFEELLALMRL
jgi:hypothetical protein